MNINISSGNIAKSSMVSSLRTSSHSLFEALVLIAVIILFYIFVISPKQAQLAAQTNNLDKLKTERQVLSQNVDKMKELINQMKDSPENIRHLDETLPLGGSAISLQLLVEKLAKESGVTAAEINFNAKNDKAAAGDKTLLAQPFVVNRSLQKITGTLYVLGTFKQLEVFIRKLQASARLIKITSLEISSSKEEALDLKINAEAYYYAE